MSAILNSCNDMICAATGMFVIFAGLLFIMTFLSTERK